MRLELNGTSAPFMLGGLKAVQGEWTLVCILLPQKRQVFGFARGLSEASIEVEVPAQKGRQSGFPTHGFASPQADDLPQCQGTNL